MRLPSAIIPLLFSIVLAAQTSTPASQPVQFSPPQVSTTMQSCPVHFSVNRQPQGAVIYSSGLGEWSSRYGNATLVQQQQALKNEHGFGQLTPKQLQEKLDQLAAVYRSGHAPQGQGVGITVADAHERIVAVDIAVHGYAAGARPIPAMRRPEEITETFHLVASEGHPLVDSSISTTHIGMVNRLDLIRIEYAGGTTWQPSSQSRCTASPSLLLLVDSAR
jgi:hypothetical protein